MGFWKVVRDARVRVAAFVGVCFLLGSTGWLSWLRHIMDLADPAQTDLFTMVFGYLAQAAGMGVFMVVARHVEGRAQSRVVVGSLVLYLVLIEPATMSGELAVTLGFGWLANVLFGIAQGHYLDCLARCVEEGRRGVVFGGGYAVSTAATWVLSSIGGGVLSTGLPCLAVCAVLDALTVALALSVPRAEHKGQAAAGSSSSSGLFILAGATVILASLVKNAGFSFPASDLSDVVNLEFSRLFYGVGLIVAGVVADRDRRYAMACCAASLVVPFFMLALEGAGASGVVLWAIGYLLYGFFVVFRVVLFADFASREGCLWLAGAGLLLGRVGDALGTTVCIACGESPLVLVVVSAVFFIAASILMFVLYQRLYGSAVDGEAAAAQPQRDILGEFCVEYGLSAREREVIPLLIDGKTNAEIAAGLFITESTVKYHMRNIRKKTGCGTRLEVMNLYIGFRAQVESSE